MSKSEKKEDSDSLEEIYAAMAVMMLPGLLNAPFMASLSTSGKSLYIYSRIIGIMFLHKFSDSKNAIFLVAYVESMKIIMPLATITSTACCTRYLKSAYNMHTDTWKDFVNFFNKSNYDLPL